MEGTSDPPHPPAWWTERPASQGEPRPSPGRPVAGTACGQGRSPSPGSGHGTPAPPPHRTSTSRPQQERTEPPCRPRGVAARAAHQYRPSQVLELGSWLGPKIKTQRRSEFIDGVSQFHLGQMVLTQCLVGRARCRTTLRERAISEVTLSGDPSLRPSQKTGPLLERAEGLERTPGFRQRPIDYSMCGTCAWAHDVCFISESQCVQMTAAPRAAMRR